MESESLYNLLQLPKVTGPPTEEELPQGEKKKYLPPTSRQDPKFEELQKHIVVRSLEEDIFDGLILHHLFQILTGLKLEVEEMALTAPSQRRKLEVVLEAINHSLQVEEQQLKWSVGTIFSKDLLATLHLLVALANHFQPDLPLPTNVQVEVITMEGEFEHHKWAPTYSCSPLLLLPTSQYLSTKNGLKSEKSVEQLTQCSTDKDQPAKDIFDELFRLAPEKVNTVKEAIVNFVNQNLARLGLSVQNLDTQEFYLTPTSPAEMLHNVTRALELLKDEGLLDYPINPEDIVNKDAKSTLRVLYSLFRKHKLQESTDSMPPVTAPEAASRSLPACSSRGKTQGPQRDLPHRTARAPRFLCVCGVPALPPPPFPCP
ncbi:hypothetical protein GH733_017477, partial [Mirounga leonina]